ncbi:hypothetical protein OIV83_004582 [Microbotryomycetes sp. JL201]|nr:hypothetical protein OIV83_004582 [Microbotryomycetes sp. JL201]
MSVVAAKVFVVFVGGGEINFGSPEGPWNHSKRVEKRFGEQLHVCGIIDPDTERANSQVKAKQRSGVPGWAHATVWQTPEQAGPELSRLTPEIDLVIVGAPPHFRGCLHAPADLDVRLLESIRARHWLVEKPVSAARPSKAAGQSDVAELYKRTGAVVGAGYMMCALKAVDEMKRIIQAKNLTVMATAARSMDARALLVTVAQLTPTQTKPAWWNKHVSCGPIVEQATHLVSLSLLFGGEPELDSVRAHTVEFDEFPGHLSKVGFDEHAIPDESRIPRYTSSVFKYKSGAVGSLTHFVGLHGTTYDTEFEVLCDGTTFKLVDMYTASPKLFIRESDVNAEVKLNLFEHDDPFQTQLDRLIAGTPTCSYDDALRTYELTWAIREAGERQVAERRRGTVP